MRSMFRHPWWSQQRQRSILCQIYVISLSKPELYIRPIYIPYLVYLNVSPATHDNAPSHIERRGFWKTSLSDLWWFQRWKIYAISHPNLNLTLPLVSHLLFGMCPFQHKRPQVILRREDVRRHQDIISNLRGLATLV